MILCGGVGSRLQGLVDDRPKPMAQINRQPFLDILTDYFSRFGFRRFVLCTGHMSEVIRDHYSHRSDSLEFVISDEQSPLGTAGSVKNAEQFIQSDPFVVTNGDSFYAADLAEFYYFHLEKQALLSMVVAKSDNADGYGTVTLDGLQRILGFEEKKQKSRSGYINAGIYLLQKDVLSFIPAGTKYSLEHDLFPELTNHLCYAFVGHEQLIDIGTPDRLESAKRFFSRRGSDVFAGSPK